MFCSKAFEVKYAFMSSASPNNFVLKKLAKNFSFCPNRQIFFCTEQHTSTHFVLLVWDNEYIQNKIQNQSFLFLSYYHTHSLFPAESMRRNLPVIAQFSYICAQFEPKFLTHKDNNILMIQVDGEIIHHSNFSQFKSNMQLVFE
jgi:hypothetical protein